MAQFILSRHFCCISEEGFLQPLFEDFLFYRAADLGQFETIVKD